jgi:hypothetical protein
LGHPAPEYRATSASSNSSVGSIKDPVKKAESQHLHRQRCWLSYCLAAVNQQKPSVEPGGVLLINPQTIYQLQANL